MKEQKATPWKWLNEIGEKEGDMRAEYTKIDKETLKSIIERNGYNVVIKLLGEIISEDIALTAITDNQTE